MRRVEEKLTHAVEEVPRNREAYAEFKSVAADLMLAVAEQRAALEDVRRGKERLDEFGRDLDERLQDLGDHILEELDRLSDESRAQREGILALIDEIRSDGDGPLASG